MKKTPWEFEIQIQRPGYFENCALPPPTATLPLPPEELLDLLHKARISDEADAFEPTFIRTRRSFLQPYLIDQPLQLHELNHFATVLAGLEKQEADVFEGLVKASALSAPAPLEKLICLAMAAPENPIYESITDLEALGKYGFDHGMFPQFAGLPENRVHYLDFEKLGADHYDRGNGAFTAAGYVPKVISDEMIAGQYSTKDLPSLESLLPEESLLVAFSKYGNGPQVESTLPVSNEALDKILDVLDCIEQQMVVALQFSILPSVWEYWDSSDDFSDMNVFATYQDNARTDGELPLYAAVLEAADCDSVLNAARLGTKLPEYQLDAQITTPHQYAQRHLERNLGADEAAAMARVQDLTYYGRDLMAKQNAVLSSYEALTRKDHGPIRSVREIDPSSYTMQRYSELSEEFGAAIRANYEAYKSMIYSNGPDMGFAKAEMTVAVKQLYQELSQGAWPAEIMQGLLQYPSPLLEAANKWVGVHRGYFDENEFITAMEDLLPPEAPVQGQTMGKTGSGL